MPIRIVLSQGQASDKTIAPLLIEQLQPGRDLIADRGYDARALVDLVARRGGRAHIPTCPDRKIPTLGRPCALPATQSRRAFLQ